MNELFAAGDPASPYLLAGDNAGFEEIKGAPAADANGTANRFGAPEEREVVVSLQQFNEPKLEDHVGENRDLKHLLKFSRQEVRGDRCSYT